MGACSLQLPADPNDPIDFIAHIDRAYLCKQRCSGVLTVGKSLTSHNTRSVHCMSKLGNAFLITKCGLYVHAIKSMNDPVQQKNEYTLSTGWISHCDPSRFKAFAL
jgi:hypothetical protein